MSKKSRIVTIEKDQAEIVQIAEKAAKELGQNHKIKFTNFIGIPTMVTVLFQEMFKYIAEHPEEGELNFMELFTAGKDDEGLYMYPGPGMKLLVKSDDETEE